MAAEEKSQDEQAEIITVGKVADDGRAVWDVDPLHPANYTQAAGEVFISDMRPYQVHNSRGIQQKIGEKQLRELGEREASRRAGVAEEADKAREEQRQTMLKQQTANSVPAVAIPAVVPDNTEIAADEQAAEDEDSDTATNNDVMAPPTNANVQPAANDAPPSRRLPRRNASEKPPER